jgi:hypothetical protein
MHQLVNLIEDIRTALTNPGLVAPDKLEEYAQQYAVECTKMNDRLKQCLSPLRSGNIAEAVRLAEMPPNIIEAFNLLDFGGRNEWLDTCDEHGFDLPPPLAEQLFQELNDAYLQTSSLEPLMEWHRFHALNGSPLRDRLAVLRSLAKADPMNLALQNDQETFEKARLDEMKQEIAEALAQKDAVRLQELYRELTDSGWRIAPPKEFLQRICTAVLEKLADELIQHFSAFDYPNAAAVYQSMLNVLYAGQMQTMPVAVERSIRAVIQWLQETEGEAENLSEFQQAAEGLRDSLEGYTPRGELENLYYVLQNAATRANQVIPQELETYYRNRVDYLTQVERNRYRVVIAIFVGSIILVGVLLAYAMWERRYAEQVAHTLETLQTLETEITTNRNAIDRIESTFGIIRPNIARDSTIAPLIARLQGMLDEDKVRAAEFERNHSLANLRMEQNLDMEGLREVKRWVDQAEERIQTTQERNLFTELRSRYDRLFSQAQEIVDREFGRRLSEYRQELYDLPHTENEEYSHGELVVRLQRLTENVRNLLSQSPDISDVQRREGNNLLDSIEERREWIRGTDSTALPSVPGDTARVPPQPTIPMTR